MVRIQLERLAVEEIFFFSSRRRHTRLTCDWSSDVCSSDLPSAQSEREEVGSFVDSFLGNVAALPIPEPAKAQLVALAIRLKDMGPLGEEMANVRSEERRVGKEGRARPST